MSYSIDNYSKKFNDVNHELRVHWMMGRESARNAGLKINELVSILNKEHPDWSVKKIAHAIWAANEDLDGFSKSTIYNYLNEDNRALLDVTKQNHPRKNVLEESVPELEHSVLEESSSDDDEEIEEPTEVFDKDFINRLIEENKQLHEENYELKVLAAATEEPKAYNRNPTGKYSKRGNSLFNPQKTEKANLEAPLTQQEQEYVQAHEDEIKRNKQIANLIESLTGKTISEQGALIDKPGSGDFRKKLAEASHDYMFKVAKQMTTSEISINLSEHRTLRYISERFSDILYEEQETRKNKEHLEST